MNDIEKIYTDYAIPVKKYVLSLCGNSSAADDITAETFYKALKNIDSFNGGKIFTWLCAIARNTYFDYINKKEYQNSPLTAEMENSFSGISPTPEDSVIKKDESLFLYRQIMKLDGNLKDVVYLRIFAGLSFKEIGDILGKSENWSRVTFYRCKSKLKGLIENEI